MTTGWRHLDGQAVALPMENVDTDQLIPARFMSAPRAAGYARFLLHDLRSEADGSAVADFPLDRHPQADVLVTGRNFGSGSSREAAVYALVDHGIRAVIAPGFGDIFAANAVNNGLLPAQLSEEEVAALTATLGTQALPVTIDLDDCRIAMAGRTCRFALGEVARRKLINGWDDIDLTGARADEIAAYRQARRDAVPWAWPGGSDGA